MSRRSTLLGFFSGTRLKAFILGGGTILAILFAMVWASQSSSAATQGPVAAWSFDENGGSTAHDLYGEADGAVEDAEWRRGIYGSALEFAGSESCVTVPNSETLQLREEFTLEAWVRPNSAKEFAPVFFKEDSELNYGYVLMAGGAEGGHPSGDVVDGTGPAPEIEATAELPLHIWSHLALTFDGAQVRLYVNGELVASDAAEELVESHGSLRIGCGDDNGYWDYFDGRIDEPQVYERALSAGEIDADLRKPLATPKQGPVAEYAFDRDPGEGSAIEDLSGDGNTATVEGAEWVSGGKYGGAMKFDAAKEDRLSVPASEDLDLEEEFTLEAWVRPETGAEEYALILGKENSVSPHFAYVLYAQTPQNRAKAFFSEGAPGHLEAEGGSPAANTWTHIAVTDDGAHSRLYVDGNLVDTEESVPIPSTDGDLVIGGNKAFAAFFDGKIDEVRIYNRPLDEAEVQTDAATPIETPSTGPVAEYSFDEDNEETATDLTGDGNTATVEGAEWVQHGKYGGAYKFDAAEGDVLTVPAAEDLDLTEEFTVEAWIKPESTHEFENILEKENSGEPGYSYLLTDHHDQLGAYLQEEPSYSLFSPGEEIEPHTWNHVALTYDGSRVHLYLDGAQVSSEPAPSFVSTDGALKIGGGERGPYGGNDFDGRIDEVRVYDRALDAAELGTDIETPIQTPRSGPVAAYAFDEGSGETVADVTGDGHTATIEGETKWAKGKYGDALSFLKEGDCATVADSPELRLTEEFTIEAWVRPDGGIYEDPVVVREAGGEDVFGLGIGSTEEGHAEAFIGEGAESETVVGGPEIRQYEWVHLAATWDGAHIHLYVDGELAATEATSVPPGGGEGGLRIGCDTPNGPFGGRIDEVRVYDRALDETEVGADMETSLQTPNVDPVAEYSFNEDNDETAEDLSGDGHTATVEGAKWTEHGRYGGAYDFDAEEEDVLRIAASPELDFDEEFTLEAWVRPSGADNHDAPLIDKQEGSGLGYFLYEGGTVSDRPVGAVEEGQEHVHADDPLPAGVWSHVALSFAGNRTYLYVDGVLVDNGGAEPVTTSVGELEIGGSTDSAEFFDGRIDEVRIYNRALPPSELDEDQKYPVEKEGLGPEGTVYHARVYSDNPVEGGHLEAQEWVEPFKRLERRITANGLESTSVESCPEEPTAECAVSRRVLRGASREPDRPVQETVVPATEVQDLPPAGTMLTPTNPEFGVQVELGQERAILKPWQSRPPGAGRIFKLMRSSHPQEGGFASEAWEFWIDAATGLPLKARIGRAGKTSSYVYYTYESNTQVTELPEDFWKGQEPGEASCEVGASAAVNPDPDSPAIVYGKTGPTTLIPEAAASDGTFQRATLTSKGIKLRPAEGDSFPLRWEVNFAPDQELITTENAVLIKSSSGEEVVKITSSTGLPIVEEGSVDPSNPNSSGDFIVIESPEESVEVWSLEPLFEESHCEDLESDAEESEMDSESEEVSPFAESTAQVIVYVNPYPGVGNVKVGLSGPCAEHEKFIGSDNKVVFGGCTPKVEYTVQVPENVFNEGRHYVEPAHIRTFTLPASNHVVEFHYRLEGQEGGGSPVPPVEEHEEFSLGLEESEQEFKSFGEEGGQPAATASDFGPLRVGEVPADVEDHLKALLTGYACAGYGYAPERAGSRGHPYLIAPEWVSCGVLNEAARYFDLTFKQSIQVYNGEEWETVAKLNGGKGLSFAPYFLPQATGLATTFNCVSIEHVHKFRAIDFMIGLADGVGAPLPNLIIGHEVFAYCK